MLPWNKFLKLIKKSKKKILKKAIICALNCLILLRIWARKLLKRRFVIMILCSIRMDVWEKLRLFKRLKKVWKEEDLFRVLEEAIRRIMMEWVAFIRKIKRKRSSWEIFLIWLNFRRKKMLRRLMLCIIKRKMNRIKYWKILLLFYPLWYCLCLYLLLLFEKFIIIIIIINQQLFYIYKYIYI